MKKDLINVIITFGLVALVFTGGSFVYKSTAEKESIFGFYQAKLQKVEDEKLALIEQNNLLEQARQKDIQQLKQLVAQIEKIKVQNTQVPLVAKNTVTNIPAPTPPPIPQQTPVKVQAPTPAPVKKQVVTKPSRTSRAS